MEINNLNRTYNELRRQSEEHLPRHKEPTYGVEARDFTGEETVREFYDILEEEMRTRRA